MSYIQLTYLNSYSCLVAEARRGNSGEAARISSHAGISNGLIHHLPGGAQHNIFSEKLNQKCHITLQQLLSI